ncbi:beta-lactamase hydrolase domain-containing protein [Perlucidibaca piscinae]|uniref:beta-lactamase hydrolase domain-containing protein n=1 Tax=Perlucidibaca piscinae TaxID=392589 RepID=UPI0003B362E3|nr:sulfur transferase domain-containing protein [Perlucidibaca piscinae]
MSLPIPNLLFLAPSHYVGGYVSPEALQAVKAHGITHVIDMLPEHEHGGFDEAAMAADLGLYYAHLPIVGGHDLNRGNAEVLDRLLAEVGDTPVLVHCMSGNRVGALFALRAHWLHGEAPEQALETGRRYGLTKLEPLVRQLLAAG